MSKNIIDGIIDYANRKDVTIGLIPSRRQVDYNYGYTGFNTAKLHSYVKGKSRNVLIQRDHAGPFQGIEEDDGIESLRVDTRYCDLIHIDPFKSPKVKSLDQAAKVTAELIKRCLALNPDLKFEIGTEQAIYPYSPEELERFIQTVAQHLGLFFNSVEYAVVQSGTGLDLGSATNTGTFDIEKLKAFIEVCNKYGLKSKEHNGDFLSAEGIKQRFESGLSGLNVAPELGLVETQVVLNNLDEVTREMVFRLAMTVDNWRKWVPKGFHAENNKDKVILMSGHYMSNMSKYRGIVDNLNDNIEKDIMVALEQRIHFLVTNAYGQQTDDSLFGY